MEVIINKQFHVSVEELVKTMTAEEVAEVLSLVALRFEEHFRDRKALANAFAEGTSEIGARFLAEICASTMSR